MLQKTKPRSNTKKVDGVIETGHLGPDGRLAWVRAYERRGPTWSDVVLLDRAALTQRLKARKRFHVGQRRELWASEFDLITPLRLAQNPQGNFLVTGFGNMEIPQDQLVGLPLV